MLGNDRATGRDAESTCDINEETDTLSADGGLDDIECTEGGVEVSMAFTKGPAATAGDASSSRRKRKHDQDGDIALALRSVGGSIEASIHTLCSHVDKLAHDYEMTAMRVKLAAELAQVEGFSQREFLQAHLKLAGKEGLMVAFTGMPNDLKLAWIRELIG